MIIVPGLIFLLDSLGLFGLHQATPVAVATSLACIIFSSLAAARTQAVADMVDWQLVRQWTPFVVLGSFVASSIAVMLPATVFRLAIGGFLFVVAVVMLTRWKPSPHRNHPRSAVSAGLGTTSGLISGLAGIGGGNIVVPTLVYFNVPIQRATAVSSTLGVPIASAGTIGYVIIGWGEVPAPNIAMAMPLLGGMLGYVYLPAFFAIITAAVITASIGVRIAHRLDPRQLRRIFGALLLVVSIRMFYSAMGT